MSFISSTNTLTLGSSTNTTINIGIDSNVVNIGTSQDGNNPSINIGINTLNSNTNPVRIRGLDPLITANTGSFANFVPNSFNGTLQIQCYYLLPYDTSRNILIQWGFAPDTPTSFVAFNKPFLDLPYVYLTSFIGGQGGIARIDVLTNSNMTVDSNVGDDNKAPYNWLAIGLTNKQ